MGKANPRAKKAPKKTVKGKVQKKANKTIKKATAQKKAPKKANSSSKELNQSIKLSNKRYMPTSGFGTFTMKEAAPIETAIMLGYRHIDTASRYGNEEEVGKAIKNSIKAGVVKRSDLFVTTKLWHLEYHDVEGALKRSLQKLGTTYVDMYLIHWPNNFFTDKKN